MTLARSNSVYLWSRYKSESSIWVILGKERNWGFFPPSLVVLPTHHREKIICSSNFRRETLFKRSLSIYEKAAPGAVYCSPKRRDGFFLNWFSSLHYNLVSVFATVFAFLWSLSSKDPEKHPSPSAVFPLFVCEFFYTQTHTHTTAVWLMFCPNVVCLMLHWDGMTEFMPPERNQRYLWSFWYFCHFSFAFDLLSSVSNG